MNMARPEGIHLLDKREIAVMGYALVDRFKKLWRKRNKESELRNVVWVFGAALNKIEAFPEK